MGVVKAQSTSLPHGPGWAALRVGYKQNTGARRRMRGIEEASWRRGHLKLVLKVG